MGIPNSFKDFQDRQLVFPAINILTATLCLIVTFSMRNCSETLPAAPDCLMLRTQLRREYKYMCLCVRDRITKYEYENSGLFHFLCRTHMTGLPP